MKDCGVSVEKADLKQFFSCIGSKKAHELITEGKDKLIKMPAVSGGGGAPAAGGAAAAAEAPKEEKKEEAEDVDMGGLFGDEDEYWAFNAHHMMGTSTESKVEFSQKCNHIVCKKRAEELSMWVLCAKSVPIFVSSLALKQDEKRQVWCEFFALIEFLSWNFL